MNNERWEQLKSQLKRNFKVLQEGLQDLLTQTQDGLVKQGEEEFLVISSPIGKVKVARESRPLVLEKKYHYTHRQGAAATAEYKYSDTEKTHKLKVYKWDDQEDDWKEISAEAISNF